MSTREAAFAAARQFESAGDWAAALDGYRNLYHNGHSHDSAVAFNYGFAHLRLGAFREAQLLFEQALSMEPDNEFWRQCLALACAGSGQDAGGEDSDLFTLLGPVATPKVDAGETGLKPLGDQSATGILDHVPSAPAAVDLAVDYSALAAEHKRSGQRWQEVQALEAGLGLYGASAAWQVRLGEARESMNRFGQAAEAFGEANRLSPGNAETLFREAFCRLEAGDAKTAQNLFAKAVAADKELGAASLGVGVFFQRRGDWPGAARAYIEELTRQPHKAEVAYRAALALERCYEWDTSAEMYGRATAMDPTQTSWHFRRGFVYERLERWSDAAEAYGYGLNASSKLSPYWAYRRGFVLERMERYEEACDAHLQANPVLADSVAAGPTSKYGATHVNDALYFALRNPAPEASMAVAETAASLGLHREAATAYQAAIDRCSDVHSNWYYRLGAALTLAKDYEAAAASFRMSRVFDSAHGVDTAGYRKDKGLLNIMYYTSWRDSTPLRDHVILYESFHGASISCNPLAIFEELSQREEFDGYLHVWVANEKTLVPHSVKTHPNVAIIRRNSAGYRRHLATAKYLINNVTFPEYFATRPGQQYLNTWHGTPLKTLGKDIGTGFLEHKNVARNFLHATHVLAANQFTADVLTRRYDVDTLMSGRVAITGYPRVDRTLNASDSTCASVKRALGIDTSDDRRVLLYAPTWRGGLSTTHFDVEQLTSDLARLAALDCHVVFRAHHRTQELLVGTDLRVTIAPESIETNELLAVVDVLITDYSSILFDFLPTGKPVTMYTYDIDEYRDERGLYLDPSAMGIPTARTVDELINLVSQQLAFDNNHGVHSDLVAEYCPREDGKASARAVDFFFFGDTSHELARKSAPKKSLLFHHSFIPNGITSSLLNLLAFIDPDEYDVTVVVPADDTAAHPERVEKFEELPSHVRVIGRVGRQLFTPEEKWIVDRFNKHRVLTNEAQMQVYQRAFHREFTRIFGTHQFSCTIEFEGYSTFWTALMAASPRPSRRTAYLHNDMRSEWLGRFPHLEAIFRIYPSYDALVSVSEVISEENRDHLATLLSLPDDKFVHAVNQINPTKTLELSRAPLDDDLCSWFSQEFTTFVTMGRMSPEKDHEKLIRAFHRFRQTSPTSRLVILGDGPLRQSLEQLITDLKLMDNVLLAGLRSNPFPALARADCFVLSSNHEGQPMVLLEALTLHKPIISTDIIGARYVLRDGYGLLVENSSDGLAKGLTRYVEDDIPRRILNVSDYQKKAYAQFLEAAICIDEADEPKPAG
ncbi:CDP-glycerol glycerophosphotransferase family protein [Pseudarthrobacter enclensis]|uniref:CDP-glycerol glycerophosphotransferase family protein n=1 Tax=Pseudarthrobacter enclensis TaxID=993070 RepID=UPI00343DE395